MATPAADRALTYRQRDVLERMCVYFEEHGSVPTVRTLAELTSSGPTRAKEFIDVLCAKGYLARQEFGTWSNYRIRKLVDGTAVRQGLIRLDPT
jgi:hypothetical protein